VHSAALAMFNVGSELCRLSFKYVTRTMEMTMALWSLRDG